MEGFKNSEEACDQETMGFTEPSIVSLFKTLDINFLEQVLSEAYSKKKRRPPHSPVAMLKALIFQKIRQIPSWRKLANILKTEPKWLQVLGLKKAPCHGSFSVFTKRLGPNRFQEMFRFLLNQLKPSLLNLGKYIAIDSTIVKGYVNPRKHGKGGSVSDPDARWGGRIASPPRHSLAHAS